jgi:VCBS repeat-containing protein
MSFNFFRKAVESQSRVSHRSQRGKLQGLRRPLRLESLEERRLLAVNVAVVDGGEDVDFNAIVTQLNDDTHFDFNATLVQPTDVDTAAEIAAGGFDVVVIGNDGTSPNSDSFGTFAAGLRDWVENQGGGVVAVGWSAFGIRNHPTLGDQPEQADLDAILPVVIAGSGESFESPGSVLVINPAHPVTAGVDNITVNDSNFFETVGSADGWGTVLGSHASGNLGVVAGVVPAGLAPGRSVYLGPDFAGASSLFDTDPLRSGEPDQLLEQAVNWAANVSAPPFGNPPTAQDQSLTTSEDTPVSGTLTAIDPDAGDVLTFAASDPPNGTVTVNSVTGAFTYTPDTGFTSPPTDSFSFTVTDLAGNSDTGTVTITVVPSFITSEVSIAATDSAAEPADDGAFTVTMTNPSGTDTTVTYNVSGSATNGTDYQPLTGFLTIPAGQTSAIIPVDVIDDLLVEGTETVFVAISAVNGSPGVVADPDADDAQLNIADNDPTTGPPTVFVDSNGNLVIRGSNQDDTVTITGIDVGQGNYTVTTQQGAGPVTTTIVTGVTGGFDINLHGGNDHLTINRAYVAGAILIEMEDGNDTVILGNVDVVSSGQRLQVGLGAGNDTIDGKRLFIGGDQLIYGGEGDDQLLFDGFAEPEFTLGTSAGGLAFWTGDGGNDTVSVIYGFIVGSWSVQLGEGTDTLEVFGSAASGDVIFSGDGGDDTLAVDTNFFDASHVILGLGGNDTVFLANGLGTEVTVIDTGDGDDDVTINNQTTNHLIVETGAGADDVDARASAFDQVFADLGDDNDLLTVHGNLVRFLTDLDGGAGDADRLVDLGNSFQGSLNVRGFELFS